ncbi:MAG TPA: hypothetical protein VLK34_06520 [Nocardioidaceae bacterium]|nr:hypothetical protein [Nocardioidaceae bacterium]
MTPEFITELHRAAEADGDAPQPPDPERLLALAKRRDSRRRTATTVGTIGLASTVVAAVGVGSALLDSPAPNGSHPKLGPAGNDGSGHTAQTDRPHQTGPAEFVSQRVARDDVIGVCISQLDALAVEPRTTWEIDPGQRARFFYAGQRVSFLGTGNVSASCTIPSGDHAPPSRVTAPIADESDTAGILQQCGVVAGFDFSDWTVDSAMTAADGTEAVLSSDNGFTAVCALQPAGWDAGSDQVVDLPYLSDAQMSRYRKGDHYDGQYYFVSLDASALDIKTSNPLSGALLWGGITMFDRNDDIATNAATVTLSYGGESITRPVVDGHVAIRWLLPNAADADVAYDVVVKDRNGQVLASYNIAGQN